MFEVKLREQVASKGDNSWEGGGAGKGRYMVLPRGGAPLLPS